MLVLVSVAGAGAGVGGHEGADHLLLLLPVGYCCGSMILPLDLCSLMVRTSGTAASPVCAPP